MSSIYVWLIQQGYIIGKLYLNAGFTIRMDCSV